MVSCTQYKAMREDRLMLAGDARSDSSFGENMRFGGVWCVVCGTRRGLILVIGHNAFEREKEV